MSDVEQTQHLRCTATELCLQLTFALDNPPTEGKGIRYQTVINMKTGQERESLVYLMRYTRKGVKFLPMVYCPFCGVRIAEQQ
jgi:hypothetical protein